MDGIFPLITPPVADKKTGGIVSATIIDLDDIRVTSEGKLDIKIVDGIVTKITMKRKGTYQGKRYNRQPEIITF